MQVKDDGSLKLSQGQKTTLLKAAMLCQVQCKMTDDQEYGGAALLLHKFARDCGPTPKPDTTET